MPFTSGEVGEGLVLGGWAPRYRIRGIRVLGWSSGSCNLDLWFFDAWKKGETQLFASLAKLLPKRGYFSMVKSSSCGSPKKNKSKANPRICSVTTGYHQIDNFLKNTNEVWSPFGVRGFMFQPFLQIHWIVEGPVGLGRATERPVFNRSVSRVWPRSCWGFQPHFFFTMKNANQTKNLLKYFYQEAGTIYINGCSSVKHCLLQSWWRDAFKTFITVAQPPWGDYWESLSYASTG